MHSMQPMGSASSDCPVINRLSATGFSEPTPTWISSNTVIQFIQYGRGLKAAFIRRYQERH
jgi:hypothetical protein